MVTFRTSALWLALCLAPGSSSAQSAPATNPQPPQGHGSHGSAQEKPKEKPRSAPQEHAAHQKPVEQKQYPAGIAPITDADRAAAFPEVTGHTVHDESVHYFVLFDQLEWQTADDANGFSWDNNGWIGGDVNRFWFRTEGDSEDGDWGAAQAHVLYGRAIARWWDLVVGVRQDIRPGPAQTWAALGIQGLAPYFFEVEATAYIGESGRTHFRVETEYELLLTNRLILQPLAEIEIYGKADGERRTAAGLSSLDAGVRLRYEFRREFAPYVGFTWNRKFFGTADLAEAAGEEIGGARFVGGLRVWF